MKNSFNGTIVLTFPHSKDELRRITVKDDIGCYDLYRISPKVSDWPADEVPDGVNPRSHDVECLKGKVAADIEKTLRDDPEDFWLANRGGFMLAEKVRFSPEKETLAITLSDPDLHGLADGATTNAVIEGLQAARNGDEALAMALTKARFNLDVVVGLTDHDRIGKLVQGRNRSVQVKEWSLADFRGGFDWLKEVVDRRGGALRGRVGWEENAPAPTSVLDLISVLTLFHPAYEGADGRRRAPTAAFSSKGTADKRLLDDSMRDGFRALAPVLEDIVELHDHVHLNFEAAYSTFNRLEKGKGHKLGARRGAEARAFKLPFTGATCGYRYDKGLIFPLLASLRCLLDFEGDEASWRTSPFDFFDAHGFELVGRLFDEYEKLRNNPVALGKNRSVYENLYDKAQNLLITRRPAIAAE